MEIIGFKDPIPPSSTPTSIGIYETKTGKQEKTCTLEMRVYRPGYVIEGIDLSSEAKRRSRRKLSAVKELLEKEFGKPVSDYLTPLREMDKRLRSREPRFGILPKLGVKYKKWEIETLLEHTVVEENGRVTETGKRIVEACKLALDPYLEFERLCLLKGIADRLDGLSEVSKLLSNTNSVDIYNVTTPSELKSNRVALIKPVVKDFFLLDVEDTPALYTFPSTNIVVFLSNLSVSEYYRFHYSLRKEIYKIHAHEGSFSGPDKLHKFANRIRVIELLRNLDVYKVEEGYRFLRFPTTLLRTLARYSLSKSKNGSFNSFLLNLKKDFRIVISPEDLKTVYSFNLSADHIEVFYETNFDMFLSRLLHAGIADLKPDGEVVLVE